MLSRQRTGIGQYIDISMTDGTVAWRALHGADYLFAGIEQQLGVVAGGGYSSPVYFDNFELRRAGVPTSDDPDQALHQRVAPANRRPSSRSAASGSSASLTAEITANPRAPALPTRSTFSTVIPPIATTG